jgi:hypothetical protein
MGEFVSLTCTPMDAAAGLLLSAELAYRLVNSGLDTFSVFVSVAVYHPFVHCLFIGTT